MSYVLIGTSVDPNEPQMTFSDIKGLSITLIYKWFIRTMVKLDILVLVS